MKIKIKDIQPNPYRYINKGYPIDKAKVEKLRSSIARTGFWDNLVARQINGETQIAYGHHRIEACRQELGKDFEIDVIIKDLDDADMLKIMAAENDNLDIMSPMVINETVRACIDFIKTNPTKFSPTGGGKDHHATKQAKTIALFLDWNLRRVETALIAISAFEKGEVDKEEYESIPFQRSAEEFRYEIKKNPIPKEQRLPIIEKLKSGAIGSRGIRQEILKAKFPMGNGNKKDVMLEDVADKISKLLKEACVLITENFIKNADDLSHESKIDLELSVKMLYGKLTKLKTKVNLKLIGA